ncbi:MAG: polysaccharide biosynthesis/export family protein [Terracidiphilus sp.]
MKRFGHRVELKRVIAMWVVAVAWPVAVAAAAGGQGQALTAATSDAATRATSTGDAPTGDATTSDATTRSAATSVATNREASPTLQHRRRYTVSPGDVMELGFPLSPEFNQSLTVAPDGFVSLRGVGDVSVEGKSLPEVRETLRKAYAGILHEPLVTVDLKDFQKPYFTVGGEVGHPGKYDLREDITVAEALAIAGGTTMNSKSSQVLLFRHLPGGSMVEVRKLDLKKMMKKGDLREDARLQPGDLVYVPKSAISTIMRFLPTSSMGLYASPIP